MGKFIEKKKIEYYKKVPGTGVEPACLKGHMNLNHARLPISPSGRHLKVCKNIKNFNSANVFSKS